MLALTAAGTGATTAGTLLTTLPPSASPSMVMVGRAPSWRVTIAAAGMVAVTGLAADAFLWALT